MNIVCVFVNVFYLNTMHSKVKIKIIKSPNATVNY